MEKGYIQVYTGNGKGKTTAALGLGLRAVGRGFKVVMVQFLKGMETGELASIARLGSDFTILRFGETKKFSFQMDAEERKELSLKILEEMRGLEEFLATSPCDILILDEILGTIHGGFFPLEQMLAYLDAKPSGMEIILTGRNLPDEIAKRAHLITEMLPVKHYMDAGVHARIGIEK